MLDNALPEPINSPLKFNDDNYVAAPERYKLLNFVLLLINYVEFIDYELVYSKAGVDVAFKFVIEVV
jgi:hypothetical protein